MSVVSVAVALNGDKFLAVQKCINLDMGCRI
jgi:hypothetical protein